MRYNFQGIKNVDFDRTLYLVVALMKSSCTFFKCMCGKPTAFCKLQCSRVCADLVSTYEALFWNMEAL